MNFARPWRTTDIANGDGVRVTLFVSGCHHHCPGCFNQEAQSFDYGDVFLPEDLEALLKDCEPDTIAGLSLLGGEPMSPENQWTVLGILQAFRQKFGNTKTVWMWTGYQYPFDFIPDGRAYIDKCTREILRLVDVIVDGPFIEAQKDISLKFRGSSNQRILHLDDCGCIARIEE